MKKPPQIKMETLNQEIVKSGFLGIDRRKVKFTYPDDSTAEMVIDSVLKNCNDAVAIIAHYTLNGTIFVYLRSCVRPPLGFRNFMEDGRPEADNAHNLFELPAGLVDKEEYGPEGLISAAQRELHEEVGINAPKSNFKQLGPRSFSSAGMTAERIFYFEVEVDPTTIGIPLEDGSALERGGVVQAVALTELVEELVAGNIIDNKTQMGIMRLALSYWVI